MTLDDADRTAIEAILARQSEARAAGDATGSGADARPGVRDWRVASFHNVAVQPGFAGTAPPPAP